MLLNLFYELIDFSFNPKKGEYTNVDKMALNGQKSTKNPLLFLQRRWTKCKVSIK